MPLSLNTSAQALRPSGIRRFSNLAAQTPDCISLTLGEPGEDTPAPIRAQVPASLEAGKTHYPPNNGYPALRQAIAQTMGDRGVSCTEDQVIVTNGATEALFSTLTALLNPGDEVVIPKPAFLLYDSIVSLCRGRVVSLDTAPASYQIDPDALEAACGPRTKAIVICSPNNPTGCLLDRRSLEAVARAAARHDCYVVCDDVYDQLVYDPGYQGFARLHPDLADRTVLVNSFSKPYAMTGWRLGWLVASAPLAAQIAKVHQFAVSCVVAFTQDAAVEALATDVSAMRASYQARRDLTVARLGQMGLPLVEPRGAFYAFPDVSDLGLASEDFCERAIREAGVALVPGAFFGGEGHVRISYATDEASLSRGLDRLGTFVAGLRQGSRPR